MEAKVEVLATFEVEGQADLKKLADSLKVEGLCGDDIVKIDKVIVRTPHASAFSYGERGLLGLKNKKQGG